MNNFNLLCIALCTVLSLCTYNASGNQMLEAHAGFVNKTNVNDNIEICIPCNDDEYYKCNISQTVIDMYPILQYFTNNQAVNKQYTIDELYTMHEKLNTDVIKYNSQLNESNSMKIPFKTINDFIAITLLEERERKVIPMWNTINDMIMRSKV